MYQRLPPVTHPLSQTTHNLLYILEYKPDPSHENDANFLNYSYIEYDGIGRTLGEESQALQLRILGIYGCTISYPWSSIRGILLMTLATEATLEVLLCLCQSGIVVLGVVDEAYKCHSV